MSATAWMKLVTSVATALAMGGVGSVRAGDPNMLTDEEKRAGFELLFNGQDLRGWEPSLEPAQLDDGPWKVQDGTIFFRGDKPEFPSLLNWRKAIPPDFDLRFEWKEASPSKWPFAGHFSIGTRGTVTENAWMGRFYCDYFAAGNAIRLVTNETSVPIKFGNINMSETPSKDARRPIGQWNEARMICKGPLFQHWLNGEKILEVDLRNGRWLKLTNESRNPLLDQWFKVRSDGFRLEIDNTDVPAWFRNFKVRAVAKDEEIEAGSSERKHNASVRPHEEKQ